MPLDSTNWPQTKPDVFSLEGLIAWLETQPPLTRYNYADCNGHCLIGQYLTAHGYGWGNGYYGSFLTVEDRVAIADNTRQTFGAALSRARALLASHPKE